jgi:type II secretory pathway component GspD/PulD (secretin)
VPQATVQIEETGIILRATPHVTRDRDIVLDLHAERSAPRLAASDAGFVFSTQNASSNVRVRDGQTIVIGGLTVAEEHRVIAGVPGLMRLPLLGRLFRSERSERIRRDLVILVTPTLIEAR